MGIKRTDAEVVTRWNVTVMEIDADSGALIQAQRIHNVVTDAGIQEIGRRVALIAPAGEDQFAVGTGTTAATTSDTSLETETYRANVSAEEGGSSGATFRFVLPSTACNGTTITEIGLLQYDDTLLARAILDTPITKTSGKAVAFVWNWTFMEATDLRADIISIADVAMKFTATDVEAALAELKTDDEAISSALTSHVNDTSDAHDASAISVLDTAGYLTATDVEAALAEMALTSRGVVVADVTLDGAWNSGATADAGTNYITVASAAGLANGTPIEFRANTGVLPGGITDYLNGAKGIGDGDYFNIINLSGNTFQICATVGGTTPVDITSAGTAGWQWRVAGASLFNLTGMSLDTHQEYDIYALFAGTKQNAVNTSYFGQFNYGTHTQFKFFGYSSDTWGGSAFNFGALLSLKYSLVVAKFNLKKLDAGKALLAGNVVAIETTDRSAATQKTVFAESRYIEYTAQDVTNIRFGSSNSNNLLIRNGSRIIVVRRGV